MHAVCCWKGLLIIIIYCASEFWLVVVYWFYMAMVVEIDEAGGVNKDNCRWHQMSEVFMKSEELILGNILIS